MAHSNRGGKHSIVRHLSIDDNKRKIIKQISGGKSKQEEEKNICERSGLTANSA